jgi:hypothetical protein
MKQTKLKKQVLLLIFEYLLVGNSVAVLIRPTKV